jgi:putative ABC transport system permease protein
MRKLLSIPFFRSFRRYNGLVLLNISGLALGLAGVILIVIWISHEISYDRFFTNSDRIYRVESLMNFTGEPFIWRVTPVPVAESLLSEFPEVEKVVRLRSGYNDVIKVEEELYTAENLYYTTNEYFNIFSAKVITGDPSRLLEGHAEIVISRRMADVMFGGRDPIGRAVLLNNKELLTVTGVIEDSPSNTHLKIDYLVSLSVLPEEEKGVNTWRSFAFITYVQLEENADAKQFNTKLSGYLQTKDRESKAKLLINPLTRLYLYRDPGLGTGVYPSSGRGPIGTVIIFAFIGGVLLLLACINFINLSTAFAAERAKETGIRKVNGASRAGLIMQLFGESLSQTLLATVAALIIVIVTLPLFNRISGLDLGIAQLFSFSRIAGFLGLALLAGIIAGVYPALILSSFSPVKVIRPLPGETTQGSGLRKILVVMQFTLSVIFIFCIVVMNRQISYMQKKNLGFNKERVMVIYPKTPVEKIDILAEQIEHLPGVSEVALGGNVPVRMGNFTTLSKWDGNVSGKALKFHKMQVDDRYLGLLGIELIEGKEFIAGAIGNEVIVNESAVKKMEMEDPVGKMIWMGETRYTIIGVVKDFHFHKLKDEVLPVFIYKNKEWWSKRIFVKLEPGDYSGLVDRIVRLVNESTPGFPARYIFLDTEIEKYYDEERRLSTLVNAATVLSIVISCIGLFSFTAFTIRRRRKEIGIRKAYGATAATVLFMLQKEFSILVLTASLIALPSGYIIMRRWLSSYSFHIDLNPLYFLATLSLIIIIASLTLIYHTLRAANLNPADTLRNE